MISKELDRELITKYWNLKYAAIEPHPQEIAFAIGNSKSVGEMIERKNDLEQFWKKNSRSNFVEKLCKSSSSGVWVSWKKTQILFPTTWNKHTSCMWLKNATVSPLSIPFDDQ